VPFRGGTWGRGGGDEKNGKEKEEGNTPGLYWGQPPFYQGEKKPVCLEGLRANTKTLPLKHSHGEETTIGLQTGQSMAKGTSAVSPEMKNSADQGLKMSIPELG